MGILNTKKESYAREDFISMIMKSSIVPHVKSLSILFLNSLSENEISKLSDISIVLLEKIENGDDISEFLQSLKLPPNVIKIITHYAQDININE